jgi:hypothetical protein
MLAEHCPHLQYGQTKLHSGVVLARTTGAWAGHAPPPRQRKHNIPCLGAARIGAEGLYYLDNIIEVFIAPFSLLLVLAFAT